MGILKSVGSVLEAYHHYNDLGQVEVSVNKLRPIFEDQGYVDKIFWEKFLFDSKFILAQIKTYEADKGFYPGSGSYARIQISKNLNYCWTRFVLCKEMYHCILDKKIENRITSTDGLLTLSEYLSSELLEVVADENETFIPFATEKLAEICAIETLFPFELLRVHCDDLDEGKITHRQLALRYRIPEDYVQIAMSAKYFSAIGRGRAASLINL